MSDLISREHMKSLGATCIASRSKDGNMFPIVSIDELPSVQPEIIRCKDCKWWDKEDDMPLGYCLAIKHGFYSRNWEISIRRTYPEDFFCADAELRGEQDG